MPTIRISEADAARDFAGLMAQVRAGVEVVIENGTRAIAVIHPALPPPRSITESIALVEAHSKMLGYKPILDDEYAADMQAILQERKPRDTSA